MSTIPQELLLAYQDTNYIVYAAQGFILRVSEYSAAFAELAETQKYRQAVFITAHNPHSNIQTPQQNRDVQDLLRAQVLKNRWNYFEGVGQSRDGSWRENSLLIFGPSRLEAQGLGKKYNQLAVVWVDESAVPEILLCCKSD